MPSWMGQNSSLGGREKGRFYVTDAYHYQYQKKKFLKKKKKKYRKEKQCADVAFQRKIVCWFARFVYLFL